MSFARPLVLCAAILSTSTLACGGGGGGGPTTIVPEGPHYHYVVNKVFVPTKPSDQMDYGLDLNGDGGPDNVLGGVLSFLSGMGFNVQATIDQAVAEGKIILLVDFQTKDSTFTNDAKSGAQVWLGDNPQPPACNPMESYTCDMSMPPMCTGCQHHLNGSGMFQLKQGQPMNAPLAGKIINGVFDGGPGELTLQIALGGTDAIELDMIGARTEIKDITGTNIGSGSNGGAILAGAITQDDINMKIIPAIAMQIGPIIVRDCCGTGNTMHPDCTGLATMMPKCGCTASSTGATIISLLDKMPADYAVTATEIQNNTTIQALLQPDVVVDGKMALSLGVKATAVGATYTVSGEM